MEVMQVPSGPRWGSVPCVPSILSLSSRGAAGPWKQPGSSSHLMDGRHARETAEK